MDMEEVKAAASRTRSWCDALGRGDEEKHEYYDDPAKQASDECLLGDWALAELARRDAEQAEREKPIDEYLLQNCGGGFVGNSPVFYEKDGCGYTPWIDEAKRWTKRDAELQIESTRGSHTWKMWSVAEIESVAKRTVDIQDLRRLKGGAT